MLTVKNDTYLPSTVVPPQDTPMNERIGYDNANYLANCSQNSAPYANAPIHN
jgi:hypothetical protein